MFVPSAVAHADTRYSATFTTSFIRTRLHFMLQRKGKGIMNLGSFSSAFPWPAKSSKDPFYVGLNSPKLRSSPSKLSFSGFSLPSDDSSSSSSSASSLSSSASFWTTPTPSRSSLSRFWSSRSYSVSRRRLVVLSCIAFAVLIWMVPPSLLGRRYHNRTIATATAADPYRILQPTLTTSAKHAPNPTKWLERNSNNKFASRSAWSWSSSSKPRAALISLVRNSELSGIVQSMTQLEYHWNYKYNYPWVFFNDEPFSDVFKVISFKTG